MKKLIKITGVILGLVTLFPAQGREVYGGQGYPTLEYNGVKNFRGTPIAAWGRTQTVIYFSNNTPFNVKVNSVTVSDTVDNNGYGIKRGEHWNFSADGTVRPGEDKKAIGAVGRSDGIKNGITYEFIINLEIRSGQRSIDDTNFQIKITLKGTPLFSNIAVETQTKGLIAQEIRNDTRNNRLIFKKDSYEFIISYKFVEAGTSNDIEYRLDYRDLK